MRTGSSQADIEQAYFNGVVFGYPRQTVTSRNCPAAPAPLAERAGASGSVYNGRFYSVFRTADNQVIQHVRTPNVGWTRPGLGGSAISPPSTIVYRGDLWVFARGSDNRLSYRVQTGSAWTAWLWMDGAISGAPAVAALGERMHVIARVGSGLRYRYYDLDTGWNASNTWLGIGQPAGVDVVTDPAIGALGKRLAVVVRGSDSNLWVRWISAGSTPGWSDWRKLAGTAAGTPAVASTSSELHVFYRTPGGAMRYQTYSEGADWKDRGLGSAPDGALFTGSPAAISFAGLLTMYSRNDAGQMLYRHLRGSTWYPAWSQLGRLGEVNLDSSPVAMRHFGTRYVAARATNAAIYSRTYRTDTEWGPWVPLPGAHPPMP